MKTLAHSSRIVLAALLILALAAPLLALRLDDDDIYDKVNQKLNADTDIHGRIKIEVKNGVVTLVGTVHDQKVKNKAEKLTRKVNGVKDVINHLEIGEDRLPK